MSEKEDFRGLHPIAISFWNTWKTHGQNTAIISGDDSYSFNDLFQEALQYLSFLKKQSDLSSRVLFFNRDDFHSYARLLAISLAGGSFVPIDSSWPEERITELKNQLKADFILDNEHRIQKSTAFENLVDLKFFDTKEAYVLYTSGSTGKPKGVRLLKSNLEAFQYFYTDQSTYSFSDQDVFLQTFQLHFDFSIFPLMMAWKHASKLVLCDFSSFRFLQIPDLLEKHKITVLTMVPYVLSYLEKYMSEFNFDSVRYSIFGGGPLYLEQAKKWNNCLSNGEIRNVYGPTETSIICSDYNGLEAKNGIVAMGYIFPNLDYKIIDQELLIAGDQTFPGYINAQEDCFVELDGKQFYPTGDLVSEDEKGLLFFEGRKDFQVKIDGYRIELEEIEGKVQEAFGISSQAELIDNELCLIVEQIPEGLNPFLKDSFPKYMQVKRVLKIDAFQLNSNRKLDRQANLNQLK